MAIQYGYKAPPAPRVPSYQVQRQTAGYQDPFPSLGGGQPRISVPQNLGGSGTVGRNAFGQQPARPPASQPVVNPQATAQNQAAPATPTVGYDYNADPILNQIQALSGQSRADAEANALGLRRQLAQQYGDRQLAQQYGGDAEAQAAAANPNSVLAQLAHSYQTGQQTLEDQLNANNLFYSGARVKQLGELANQYQGQVAGATGQEQDALNSIAANLAAAKHAADLQDQQAQMDAYNRALQAALAAGSAGGGGGGDVGGGGGDVGAPTDQTGPFDLPAIVSGVGNVRALNPSQPLTWGNLAPPISLPDIVSGSGPLTQMLSGYGSTAQRRRQTA